MIIAANHLSHFDAMALVLALPVQGVWIGKKELRYVPVVGWKLSAFECIFIDRGNHSKALASMSRAAEKTRNGRSVYIFPEGTRSREAVQWAP
jgi:1-acyl-sn-glycerol-3-phosphate acyltransferase